jgi:hypothetical protein
MLTDLATPGLTVRTLPTAVTSRKSAVPLVTKLLVIDRSSLTVTVELTVLPKLIAEAPLPILTVVALLLAILNAPVVVVVMSPPLTAISPDAVMLPVTETLLFRIEAPVTTKQWHHLLH